MKFFDRVQAQIKHIDLGQGCLILTEYEFTDETIEELISLIKNLKYLRILDLSYNNIGSAGACALATLTHIICLNLAHNNIGGNGKEAEAMRALGQHSVIRQIDLTCNNLSDVGAAVLAECAQQTILKVGNNKITADLERRIGDRVNHNLLAAR